MLKKKASKKPAKKSARRPVGKTVHKRGKRRTTKGEWSVAQALAGFAGRPVKRSAERQKELLGKREAAQLSRDRKYSYWVDHSGKSGDDWRQAKIMSHAEKLNERAARRETSDRWMREHRWGKYRE